MSANASDPSPNTNSLLGRSLSGRYRVVRHLGGGGFGQTYIAEDCQLPGHPQCVVKQLKPQTTEPLALQTARRLFDREVEVLYRLGIHEQIPRLFAHFEEDREFYLVQEFIEGHILSQELTPGQRMSAADVVDLLQDILTTLNFVHQQHVIHRDLKPSNLIRRQQDRKIVLIDFGAVKQISSQIINPQEQTITVAIGSPGYMPNEQLAGHPRFSSDIFAVGIIGIQALTGLHSKQLSVDPSTSEIIWRDQAQVSPGLADVLDKMVRYDFRQRYQSTAETLQALTASSNPMLLPTRLTAPNAVTRRVAEAQTRKSAAPASRLLPQILCGLGVAAIAVVVLKPNTQPTNTVPTSNSVGQPVSTSTAPPPSVSSQPVVAPIVTSPGPSRSVSSQLPVIAPASQSGITPTSNTTPDVLRRIPPVLPVSKAINQLKSLRRKITTTLLTPSPVPSQLTATPPANSTALPAPSQPTTTPLTNHSQVHQIYLKRKLKS